MLAFAAPHATLQEVVGVALITTTRDAAARPTLAELHRWCGARLHPPKWPQLVVFMDNGGLPKGVGSSSGEVAAAGSGGAHAHANTAAAGGGKLLRIRFAEVKSSRDCGT